jgi:uncharacterized membrane protein
MTERSIPKQLFWAIAAVAIAQAVYAFPLMPGRMASHFGPSGMPNGWMTKSQFFAVYAFSLLPAFVLEFWLPRKLRRTDGDKLNLPNKEYWLAPERRDSTFAYLEAFFAWYGCAFLLLIVFVMGLAMRANLNPSPRLPTGPTVTALIVFVAFTVAAIVAMLRRFSAPRST